MNRVFIDNQGRFYKAKEAADASHAERSLVTADMLAVLPDDGTPIYQVEIDQKVKQLADRREGAANGLVSGEKEHGEQIDT